jgi:hypothetical protein
VFQAGARRRRALWATGIASFALLAVLAVLDFRMTDTGGPGIVGFELAGSRDEVREILADWGDKGHDAARLSLWLDFPYLLAYGTFLWLVVAAVRDGDRARGWARRARVGGALVIAPLAAAALDSIENVWLLLALGGHGGEAAPALGRAFATGKFALMAAIAAYLFVAASARIIQHPSKGASSA